MDSQRYLSKEYRGVFSGWVRGSFVEVSRDDRGSLTQVLYTYQVIDEEKKKDMAAVPTADPLSLQGPPGEPPYFHTDLHTNIRKR